MIRIFLRTSAIVISTLIISSALAGDANKPKPPFADHIEKMLTVPNVIDSDGDGELSIAEVQGAPAQLAKLDKNKDGILDPQEIGAWEPVLTLVRSHKVTNLVDADGDVYISADEIKNAAESLKYMDRNNDWHISKGEMSMTGDPDFPVFNMRQMPAEDWMPYRSYTDRLEGPVLPGADDRAYEGYILVHDAGDWNLIQRADTTYLLDMEGNKIHEWEHTGYSPEATVAYLLPNGNLLRTLSKHHWTRDKNFPVGAATTIELVGWDGKILWDYSMSVPEKYSFHHDVEYMPDGNILAIRYNAFTIEEAHALGWDPSLGDIAARAIHEDGLVWMSNVVELKPDLNDGSTEIVWEWNSWDHLVQDRFPKSSNFGDITDPRKIHVNYLDLDKDVPYNAGQLFHLNTVDYNPRLDMIVLSSPTYGEIWFIDHSTTREEAATGKGGRQKMGGDILYRWGNDETFGAGVRDGSVLYWQHDAQWIGEGLPGAGNILVFNNGNRRTLDDRYMVESQGIGLAASYSNLVEVKMPMNRRGGFDRRQQPEVIWTWEAPNREEYYSPFMSGVQRLPNGNTIFNRAYDKYITEVTPDGDKVLDFSLEGWGRLYRIYKYGPDYEGLGIKTPPQPVGY